MPDWLTDFLGGFSINLANAVWNKAMGLISGMLATSPQAFSAGAWGFVENTLYPWALSIGVGMLNLFFIIAMLQAVSDFSHNITLEMAIEALIKIVAANVLFLNLLKLIKLRTGILMLGGEGLHRVDHGQQQLALIASRVQAHALGQALQIGHLFTHTAHREAAFLPLTRGTCRSRRGYPRGSCRRC